jgi:4-oxalocrotonate tautomerase
MSPGGTIEPTITTGGQQCHSFTSEQKEQIVERLTDAMVSVEGENMRGVTWVVVEEVRSGDWGIGGQPLTTEAVKALAAGTPA